MAGSLTSEQQNSYRRDGFLFPVEGMSAAEAAQHCERLEVTESQHGPMHYRVKPYLVMTSAFEIATHPVLLDAVESVLGPDILLWDSSYIVKEPHSDDYVSWHQDLTYWGLHMKSDFDLVSAWVALTPATPGNGCMQFVRGSHTVGTFEHNETYAENNILHRGQSIRDSFDEQQIVQVELKAGQVSFHQGWTVHASAPNASDDRRIGLVMNYVKPSVRQVVGGYETTTLVRGIDNYGYFRPEPVCNSDFAAANVAFQLDVEGKKREVYDSA